MRRVVAVIDQLPAWVFVGGAVVLLGGLRAGGMYARLHGNAGGREFSATLLFVVFLVLLVFAVRRKQAGAFDAAAHLLLAMAGGNVAALFFLWPFLPHPLPISLVQTVLSGLAGGLAGAAVAAPFAAGLLWLSRRYGSHSLVTERRERVVDALRARRAARRAAKLAARAEGPSPS